jgi:hypothetical protein
MNEEDQLVPGTFARESYSTLRPSHVDGIGRQDVSNRGERRGRDPLLVSKHLLNPARSHEVRDDQEEDQGEIDREQNADRDDA